MTTQPKIQTIDTGRACSYFVDCVLKVQKVGAVTHILFAETTPTASNKDTLFRDVNVRLVVPTAQVLMLGRSILAGATGNMSWVNLNSDDEWQPLMLN